MLRGFSKIYTEIHRGSLERHRGNREARARGLSRPRQGLGPTGVGGRPALASEKDKETEMDIKVDQVQDSIGQMCPMPIAYLARNMRKMEAGQVLEIQADDEGAHADIPAWCEQTGNEFLGEEEADGFWKYYVKKAA